MARQGDAFCGLGVKCILAFAIKTIRHEGATKPALVLYDRTSAYEVGDEIKPDNDSINRRRKIG